MPIERTLVDFAAVTKTVEKMAREKTSPGILGQNRQYFELGRRQGRHLSFDADLVEVVIDFEPSDAGCSSDFARGGVEVLPTRRKIERTRATTSRGEKGLLT